MKKWLLLLLAAPILAHGQVETSFTFVDTRIGGDKEPIRLQAFEYRPTHWNGKVILMSHGSTGGFDKYIKPTIRYLNISKQALPKGYIFVTWMRKGRGQSEGKFTEETGRCDYGSLSQEVAEAEAQLQQVIEQVRARYGVSKLILMGHSRGGFLSAIYAGRHPEAVSAVVNLAGAWSAGCESRSGRFGRYNLEASAKKFGPQYWAYFDKDSYFVESSFNDPDYEALSSIALRNGVKFERFGPEGMDNGHDTPIFKPWTWAPKFFPSLDKLPVEKTTVSISKAEQ